MVFEDAKSKRESLAGPGLDPGTSGLRFREKDMSPALYQLSYPAFGGFRTDSSTRGNLRAFRRLLITLLRHSPS
mgnify:CR=1